MAARLQVGNEVWPYLTSGGSVHIVPDEARTDPVVLKTWLEKQKITVMWIATPMAEIVMDWDWSSAKNLRILYTAGDKLHRGPRKQLPFEFWNLYGPQLYWP